MFINFTYIHDITLFISDSFEHNCISIAPLLNAYKAKMSCKKGANWTEGETRTFLELAIEKSILNIIDGKKYRHIEIFQMLVPEMQKRGYEKTAEQMKLKLKNLKVPYFKCKRNNNISGAAPSTCPFYNELDILYGSRPSTLASSNQVIGFDTAEKNENESNIYLFNAIIIVSYENVNSYYIIMIDTTL
jgi:hypothetical protein